MQGPKILETDTDGNTGRTQADRRPATATATTHEIQSAEAWFAGGERMSYDPKARAIVQAQRAPLNVFLRREGDIAHAVSFLPGFPDGSFGWAKVLPHLPNAEDMSKLFIEYIGMGDSDNPKDYAYSTAERTDLVEAIWRDLGVRSTTLVAFDFSSLVILEHLRRRLERSERARHRNGRTYAVFSSSMAVSSQTGTRILGTPRRCCAVFPAGPASAWAGPFRCSRECLE